MSLGATPAPGSVVSVTGYPLGVGGGPVGCRGTIGVADGGYPSLLCGGLVDGTSGAPWISASMVTGVTGGFDGGGCDADVSYSAPFDDNTSRLLARAQAGGPGDAAPNDVHDRLLASVLNWLSARSLFITSSAATLYASENVG